MAYKYPYISREYYAAVMFACKMIRQNGYFNKAIQKAADYYGVDEDKLAKHVRARQGAGQKGTTRKYKWYLLLTVEDCMAPDDCGTMNSWFYYTEKDWRDHSHKTIVKATSRENAKKQAHGYSAGEFEPFDSVKYIEEYDTEEEAQERKKKLSFREAAKLMNIERLNDIIERAGDNSDV